MKTSPLIEERLKEQELISLSPMDVFEAYRILSVLLEAEILAVEPAQS